MIIFNSHKALEVIKPFFSYNPVIVEAGAFDGQDTKKMAQQWPQGTIHAFEPVPEIYERLMNNTHMLPHVQRYRLALSNHSGTAQFYIAEKPQKPGIASQAGSLYKPKERLQHSSIIFPRMVTVNIVTLDEWADRNGITAIDLLWLDTQGHELAILQAAPHMVNHIKVIFAEVSFIESYQNQPLYKDVVTWMADHGFEQVGRDFEDETKSFFGNVLFVRK